MKKRIAALSLALALAVSVTACKKDEGIYTAGTYTGTGTYGLDNPTSLSFPWPPLLVLVLPSAGSPVMWARRDAPYARPLGGEYYHGGSVRLTWQGNNLSWYNEDSAAYQLNGEKTPYFVIAFGSAG